MPGETNIRRGGQDPPTEAFIEKVVKDYKPSDWNYVRVFDWDYQRLYDLQELVRAELRKDSGRVAEVDHARVDESGVWYVYARQGTRMAIWQLVRVKPYKEKYQPIYVKVMEHFDEFKWPAAPADQLATTKPDGQGGTMAKPNAFQASQLLELIVKAQHDDMQIHPRLQAENTEEALIRSPRKVKAPPPLDPVRGGKSTRARPKWLRTRNIEIRDKLDATRIASGKLVRMLGDEAFKETGAKELDPEDLELEKVKALATSASFDMAQGYLVWYGRNEEAHHVDCDTALAKVAEREKRELKDKVELWYEAGAARDREIDFAPW